MEDDPRVTLTVQSLLDERHTLITRTLSQPTGSGEWVGCFSSTRRGHGTDFDDLRHYTAGDDLRHIDWKASARTHTLHTRLYREEKEYRVTIVADIRRSMFCGSSQLRAVHACRLAARMLWQSVDNGSRACVIALTDEGVYATEHAAGHKAAIEGCGLLARQFLNVQQTQVTNKNASPSLTRTDQHRQGSSSITRTDLQSLDSAANDAHSLADLLIELPTARLDQYNAIVTLDSVVHWLLQQPRKTHSLLWVSGMDDCGEHIDSSLESLSQLTPQAAIYIDDPITDSGLPSGRYGYLSRSKGNLHSVVNLSFQDSGKLRRALDAARQQLKRRFDRLHIPFLSTSDNDDHVINSLRHHGYLP